MTGVEKRKKPSHRSRPCRKGPEEGGSTPEWSFHPLAPERWEDLARLFGKNGACAGCWCMYWRQTHAQFERLKGDANRRAFRRLLGRGVEPGILATVDGDAVGWCAVAPREEYTRLARSRVLAPVDSEPVWSVVCFFVSRKHRRQGLTVALLRAALDFARDRGARIVEGYPIEPRTATVPAAFAYTGLASAFRRAGFEEVLRRSKTRPIMRCVLVPSGGARERRKPAPSARS